MAHQMIQAQQHLFRYKSFHIDKSQPLGHGSYGAVYNAKCDQLPCAAKVLHPTILDPGAGKIMNRFRQECAFLESIRHPNIVQYLGMNMDPDSGLVLLMELLDESLTKMLERSQHSLAYYVQVDICHDIALAVDYLHSNDIIHRDLSSNNVLIIAGRRAKVTDFGMSKLAGAAPSMTPLTMCPGTLAYMPPEALREPPNYTKKLDCFSEGVIMIQVCTRLWPEPGPRTQLVLFPASPTGTMEMPVLETERRKNHIDLIDPTHALLPIVMDCLKYQERERPSSEELCQRLAGLKVSRHYKNDVEQHNNEIGAKDSQIASQRRQLLEKNRQLQDKDRQLQDKDKQLQDKDRQLQDKHRKLQDKDQQLQDKDRQLQDNNRQLQDKDRQLQDNSRQLQDKDRQLQDKDQELQQHQVEIASRERQLRQLNQLLEEQEQVIADIQQTSHSLQRQVEQLQQQLSQQIPSISASKPHPPKERKLTLTWRDGDKVPFKMARGAAVVDGNVAYFMNDSGDVCSYNSTTMRWSLLPKYTYRSSSLAVINGQLTVIGGCKNAYWSNTYTNKLLSLDEGFFYTSWSDVFPPMPTKRCGTTVITSKEHLIVAGGDTGPLLSDALNTVEVLDTKALVWSTVASLPHRYYSASSTICGDHLYMLGELDDNDKTKLVLTCSLTELLQSSSSSVWHRVADAPAYNSTCAAVNGELLAVGGCDENRKATSAVHKYNPTTNSWDLINNMPTARYRSLVAVLPNNEVMTVGGWSAGDICYNIEIATFTFIE